MNTEIICLITSVRGGSKLFHSLLDAHPQIICFPRTFLFLTFLKLINNELEDSKNIADSFIKNYPRFFDGLEWNKINPLDKADMLGPNSNESFLVSKEIFKNCFVEEYDKGEKNSKNLFLSLHYAFHRAKGFKITPDLKILYHIHDISFTDDLAKTVEDFGYEKVKTVFCVRHPLDGLKSSAQKYINLKKMSSINFYITETFIYTSKITKLLPKLDLKVIYLETVRSNRIDVMKAFQRWVNIEWNDSLLKSSLMGKKWLGNAKEKKGNVKYSFDWYSPKGIIENKDMFIYNALFPNRFKLQGEKTCAGTWYTLLSYLLLLLPMKVELLIWRNSLSIRYWFSCYQNIKNDIYITDKTKEFLIRVKRGNLLTCIYHFFKRVKLSYSAIPAYLNDEKNEVLYWPMSKTRQSYQ